ncbi:MAG: tRNA glutamyl-Q(34) synthetase GluQRS [Terrimicrobiaceae bacterium]
MSAVYRGRLAPTPTGYLHLGHAATFRTAWQRARAAGGSLALRIENLDPRRCRPAFEAAALEDLTWCGLDWDGEPIRQSERRALYLQAWQTLRDGGWIYPCSRSRRDIATSPLAPHGDESIFPAQWRTSSARAKGHAAPEGVNWRFCVPDGRVIRFDDRRLGVIEKIALQDFGDFVIWNRDNVPAYELAVVVDDATMDITEIVRGEDLLTSTARQILLYEALQLGSPPATYHCPLVRDSSGQRLAKRHDSKSLRAFRQEGRNPEDLWTELDLGPGD